MVAKADEMHDTLRYMAISVFNAMPDLLENTSSIFHDEERLQDWQYVI